MVCRREPSDVERREGVLRRDVNVLQDREGWDSPSLDPILAELAELCDAGGRSVAAGALRRRAAHARRSRASALHKTP